MAAWPTFSAILAAGDLWLADPGQTLRDTAAAMEPHGLVAAMVSGAFERYPSLAWAAAALLAAASVALLRDWLDGPRRRRRWGGRALLARDRRTARHRLRSERKGRRGESAVMLVLARLGYPALHDVVLADKRGVTQIDHIVRTADGIAVLETKTMAGVITGAVRGREWTQQLADGTRMRFQNPHRQNYRHVKAVERVVAPLPVPVRGYVVAAGSARFCDDLGDAVVSSPEALAVALAGAAVLPARGAELEAAWQRLVMVAGRSLGVKEEHRAGI